MMDYCMMDWFFLLNDTVLSASVMVFAAGAAGCLLGTRLAQSNWSGGAGIVDALRDLTGRGSGKKEIDRVRKKYRCLLEGAPDAIFVAEKATGNIVEANQAAADLLGTSVESIVGRNQFELHPSEEKDRYRAFFVQAAMEGQEMFSQFEDGSPLVIVTDSEERVPVEISATPAEIEGEEYVIGIFRDISRRRRSKRRMHIFEQAIEHSAEAIFVADRDGEILYANPATEEITGYEGENIIGANPRLWQSGETPEATYEEFWDTIQRGEVYQGTFVNETKDGARLHFDEIVVPTEGLSGEIQYYVAMGRDVTEQKEAQRKLREQEERLRGLANSIPGVAFQFYARPGETYGAHFVSDHAEELLGISPDPDTFYERFLNRVPESAREDLRRSVEEAVQTQERWRQEIPFDRPDGKRIWLMGVSIPAEQAATTGDETIFNGVLLDVTERKHQEEVLAGRQEKVEALYEATRSLLAAESREAVTERIHEVLDRLFDYAVINTGFVEGAEVVPAKTTSNWTDLPSPTRQPLDGDSISAQTLRAGERVVIDDVQALDSGAEYGFLESAAGVPIGARGAIVIGQNEASKFESFDLRLIDVLGTYASMVLARLNREQELRDTRERMNLTLQHTGSVVFEIDLKTRSVIREGQGGFFHCTPERLPSWDVFAEQAVHPEDQEAFCRFYRALEEGRKESGVLEYRTCPETGSVQWIQDTVFAEEEDGRRRLRGLAQQITRERKRLEKLTEAKAEAEAANRMKSAFLANMSHEIRTPLTSIIGFAEAIGDEVEALRDHPGGADLSQLGHFSRLIQKGGTRLLKTLEGVLNLSKLETGQMELSSEPVDLAGQAQWIAEELRAKAQEKGLDLDVRAGEVPAWARADEGGVQIVLQNLVSNAIKYTEPGGEVQVRSYRQNGSAVLEVEDTGIGMDPEVAEDLFEPFRQASEGLDREYEGVGVGLAVTKKAVEEMGGTIEVDTEKGKGSRFVVGLPNGSESGQLAPDHPNGDGSVEDGSVEDASDISAVNSAV